ncbi:ABC transporter substrate-binding protein [Intrasporangium chromatireducens]|uniref:ABC transporter substrate-binding protein n=1 Tax=Intrasporangium chromatireducens TaxID=1386088 RepID=UPI00138E38B3|nr:ABC transporter substrate-binding protein [Intrasporangium chromatireducens]
MAALFLGACGSSGGGASGGQTADGAAEAITVSAFTKSPVSTIDQMVVKMGFLKEEGVDAKILEIPSGPQMVASLIGGTSQVTGGSPALVYPLLKQGQCLRYLGPGMGNMYNLIARPDANIPGADKGFPDSVRGLKGKTIGVVARGSATEVWMTAILRAAGVDPKDVTFIAVGAAPTALPTFQQGKVDAMIGYPPLNQMLAAQGIKYTFLTDTAHGKPDTLKNMLQVGSVTTCDFAEKHPETVTAYCNAIQKAYAFLRDEKNAPAMATFLTKTLGVDSKTATDIWAEIKTSFPSDKFTKELFDEQVQFLPGMDHAPDYSSAMQPNCVSVG